MRKTFLIDIFFKVTGNFFLLINLVSVSFLWSNNHLWQKHLPLKFSFFAHSVVETDTFFYIGEPKFKMKVFCSNRKVLFLGYNPNQKAQKNRHQFSNYCVKTLRFMFCFDIILGEIQ